MTQLCMGKLEALWVGEMQRVQVVGRAVLLVRHEQGVCAYTDRCAHLGVALSEGELRGHTLTCRAHGWSYDVRSGRGINPARARLTRWPVEVRDGQIWLGTAELQEAQHD